MHTGRCVNDQACLCVCEIKRERYYIFYYNSSNHCMLSPGELDYTPSEVSLSFSPSSNNQTKCEEFSITQDGLDEPAELFQFTFALDTKLQQNIIINVIIFACEKGGKILFIRNELVLHMAFRVKITASHWPFSK